MWMALAIGNSRLHWGLWEGHKLKYTWHSPYVLPTEDWREQVMGELNIDLQDFLDCSLPLVLTSVVPSQTNLWRPYAQQVMSLSDIPLFGLYSTLGIDRALAVYGAGETSGYPVLVVDGGTALTMTGVNGQRQLIGGAIWPGLGLQWQSLQSGTAALADFSIDWQSGHRWAMDTPGAIASGILHSTVAGIIDFWQDWQSQFPSSQLLLTGGDGEILSRLIRSRCNVGKYAPDLVLHGISLAYNYYKK
jgi:type III pantothenate kinase